MIFQVQKKLKKEEGSRKTLKNEYKENRKVFFFYSLFIVDVKYLQ